jgi:hypothetical protein
VVVIIQVTLDQHQDGLDFQVLEEQCCQLVLYQYICVEHQLQDGIQEVIQVLVVQHQVLFVITGAEILVIGQIQFK